MSAEATLIDEIVQRVLKELGTAPDAAPTATGGLSDTTASAVAFDVPVVTREILEKRAGSATHISLRAGAIVTPSARDFIRERKIEVAEATAAAPARAVSSAPLFVLVASSTPQLTAALAASRSAGVVDQTRVVGTAAEGANEAISLICRGEAPRVVVFSDEPELVACLTNRNERIRAAVVADHSSVERLRASLKTNVFVVSPTQRNEFETIRLLKSVHST